MILLALLVGCKPLGVDFPRGRDQTSEVPQGCASVPAGLDLGAVEVGEVGRATLVVSNPCDGDLDLHALELISEAFAVEGEASPLVVSPGAEVSVEVAFAPPSGSRLVRPGDGSGVRHYRGAGGHRGLGALDQ